MNERFDLVKNGFVAVQDGKIIEIGENKDIDKYSFGEIIGGENDLVMPGLVNTHTHSGMAFFRGLADDLILDDWLENHIWPTEAEKVNPEFLSSSAELSILEMIKSGTTCFNDMYFFASNLADVAEKSGIRAFLGEAVLDFPTPSCKSAEEALQKTINLAEKLSENELLKATCSPHSVYACSEKTLLACRNLAENLNLPIHIHLAETEKEVGDCLEKTGKTPVAYLDELGLLTAETIAAHSIWLSDDDLNIFEKKEVKISHNPASNMKLASGVMNWSKIKALNLKIGLGTDGPASNNNLDLLEEAKICALLHKIDSMNPTRANAREVLRSATLGGAEVLGISNQIGSLEPGKKADIITINTDKPHLTPLIDPYSQIVYCANGGDVENVLVAGRVLMKKRQVRTLDERRILGGGIK